MGTTGQRRLIRRLDLERLLQEVPPHPSPKAELEQYAITAEVAAEVLFLAAYVHDDIIDKSVVELGCGTGRLAIGVVFLGAAEAVGVDIDRGAVRLANKSAEILGLKEKTHWVIGDIDVLRGRFDTALQNPPFGVQRRSADQRFLLKALELASRVYSLHKGGNSNRAFIKRFIEGHCGKVTGVFPAKLNIPRLFKFHTERKHEVDVDLYRITGA